MFRSNIKSLIRPRSLPKSLRSSLPVLNNRFSCMTSPKCQFQNFHTGMTLWERSYEDFPSKQLAQLNESGVELAPIKRMRNIGISAHIDSGKTTVSERILFYTGRIKEIHEVKGTDEVGAYMDHMDLEREKGITIQSAATFCEWKGYHMNLIDTPGHVDFTIEVERALRVLDGAILVLCAIGGVQSQSITVDRQMKRYNVPRVCFINKLDRIGADPWAVIDQLRTKLGLNACAVQVPMGTENNLQGIVDLIEMKAMYFKGKSGGEIEYGEIPEQFSGLAEEKRAELLEKLAEVDQDIEEKYLMDETPTAEEIRQAIRRQTLHHRFIPVFMGSAKVNVGVQPLMDAALDYLPNPAEVDNYALAKVDKNTEEPMLTVSDPKAPFIGLAFKLEESQYGQLTYLRIYQGSLKVGDSIYNTTDKKKIRINRLGRMHSNKMEEIKEIGPGEICALFGVTCASGDSFTKSPKEEIAMESMFIPEPVVSLSVKVKDKKSDKQFSKALARFVREDPTFRVSQDPESGETIIHGMGELHLEIYTERMKREYNCPVETGEPYVAYREAIRKRVEFNYLHKKQSGGAGQYAGIKGYFEPLDPSSPEKFIFEDHVVGNNLTPGFIQACDKGFREAFEKGPLIEAPVWGVKVVLEDGQMHSVDSSELAFKLACQGAFREFFPKGMPTILEPYMKVEVTCPTEFQNAAMGSLTRRSATITGSEMSGAFLLVKSEAPLREMFGYISELRALTQGKGEFSMEYCEHRFFEGGDRKMKEIVASRKKSSEEAE